MNYSGTIPIDCFKLSGLGMPLNILLSFKKKITWFGGVIANFLIGLPIYYIILFPFTILLYRYILSWLNKNRAKIIIKFEVLSKEKMDIEIKTIEAINKRNKQLLPELKMSTGLFYTKPIFILFKKFTIFFLDIEDEFKSIINTQTLSVPDVSDDILFDMIKSNRKISSNV